MKEAELEGGLIIMKNTLVSVLVFLLIMTLTPINGLASTKNVSITVNGYDHSEIVLDDGCVLVCEDMPDGNARFLLKKNGDILSSAIVNRQLSTLQYSDFRSGKANTTTESVLEQQRQVVASKKPIVQAKGYTYAGRITYKYYVEGIWKNCSALAYYDRVINPRVSFDVYGQYRDVAKYAGYIAAVLGLPGAIAGKVAAKVVAILGFSAAATDFIVPKGSVVDAVNTNVRWKVEDSTNAKNYDTFSGDKYEYSFKGKSYVAERGDFYPITTISKKTRAFAVLTYDCLFVYNVWEVSKWTPA